MEPVDITVNGVTFYFIKDREGFISLSTDGYKPDDARGMEMLTKVRDFLRSNQSTDDRELDHIMATQRRMR